MSRNNDKNIKKHNDKLHKSQPKATDAEASRKEKPIKKVKQYNVKKKGD